MLRHIEEKIVLYHLTTLRDLDIVDGHDFVGAENGIDEVEPGELLAGQHAVNVVAQVIVRETLA